MTPVQENLTLSPAEQQKLDMLATDALRGIHARYRDILLAQQRQLIGRADEASTPTAAARDRYLGESLLKNTATTEALEAFECLCGGRENTTSTLTPAACFRSISHAVKDLKVAPSEICPRLGLTPKALMNKAARLAFTKEKRREFAKQSDQKRHAAFARGPRSFSGAGVA